MTFRYSSDCSLLVDLDPLGVRRLLQRPVAGVRNMHPAYRGVLVVFDPLVTDHERLEAELALVGEDEVDLPAPRTVEIPVRYDGPDLEEVAALHQLRPGQVVEIHASAVYTVGFLGFVPGFAYLSGLDPRIATPRLATPRASVPAGSVGIAGMQTGVYPFVTPGGWNLIGRTELKMFETNRAEMSLLRLGDQVRFVLA